MAYSIAVGQSWVSRSDFWAMPCAEFWWLVSAKMPEFNKPKSDMAEVLDMVKAAKAAEAELNG